MSRCFVIDLVDGQPVDQTFLASEKQLRTNRNGNLYLQVRLSDRTGSLTSMMWNANQRHFDSFDNGDYVHVEGTAQLYNGSMQILAKQIGRSTDPNIDETDFVTLSQRQLEQLVGRVQEILRGVGNPHLRNLADCFFADDEFLQKFQAAPAGIKNHHAYLGGLLEHVTSLLEVCLRVAPLYPQLDLDLLLMGAFLHDVGKIEELTYSPDLGYSDAGQLVGHLVLGVGILDRMLAETQRLTGEDFPAELANQLRHFIVSHHGSHEFGSPQLPMTLEAITLHYLDSLDARLHQVCKLIEEDPNKESRWTPYQPQLGRKLYKPG